MKSYHHFTTLERECLLVLLQKNMSLRKIAAELGRSPQPSAANCHETQKNTAQVWQKNGIGSNELTAAENAF